MIRVAILGAGFMGATHAGAWKALAGRVEVVAVASRTLANVRPSARWYTFNPPLRLVPNLGSFGFQVR